MACGNVINWIPTSKKELLPSDGEQKLITYIPYMKIKWKDGENGKYCITMAHYNEDDDGCGHWVSGGYYMENVIAWTDIDPYIPKEEENGSWSL